jgi:hypothetical protein
MPIAASLAALGIYAGATTDQRLHEAPPLQRLAPSDAEISEDTPDAKPVIDPDAQQREAEQRRRAEIAKRDADAQAKRDAEAKAQRDREIARDAATPGYLNFFHWGGLVLASAGAITAVATYAEYDPAKTTHVDYNTKLVLNSIGWAAMGIGAAGFISFFVFRPSLSAMPAKGSVPATSVSVGLGGVRLEGAF